MIKNDVHRLLEESAVARTINRLFIATDNSDWSIVKLCFADSVIFDMTSMAGGEPARLSPQEIADLWQEGLKDMQAVHHQSGNFVIDVRGDHAEAFCYGIAIHYKQNPSNINTLTFVGSYEFSLIHIGEEWKIDSFKFNLKFADGNIDLE
jgi:hypothetical protein